MAQVTRLYSGFRGVDFRGEDVSLSRSPDSINMWRDYRQVGGICTRPALERLQGFQIERTGLFGMFLFDNSLFVHAGVVLFRFSFDENGKISDGPTILSTQMNRRKSLGFTFADALYIMDGKTYWYIERGSNLINAVTPHIPTTTIGRKPAGGGTVLEDVNMLSPYRINSFVGDGTSTEYVLDGPMEPEGAQEDPVTVWINGVETNAFTFARNEEGAGKITFEVAPPAPLTDGQDNVKIQYLRWVEGADDAIYGCTQVQVFDNRVFLTGNPNYPNVVWHSSLNDPTYFSDLDYYRDGVDDARITGMVAGNNALWVFRENSDSNTTIFYHVPTIDDSYGKIYPSAHSSITTGCIGKAINFNDDIVFFSEKGMEGISGDITTEQVLGHRSSLVDRKLTSEPGYKDMILCEWEGYLLVFIGNHVYLADSRSVFQHENHMEYDWYYWELEFAVEAAKVYNGVLYLWSNEVIYTVTGDGDVESYWVTPKDRFQYPNMQKTTNKRGCIAEATGDVSVWAKTDKSEFEHIGDHKGVTDYFASRIKRKKFKDLQIKFASSTRFSLEQVSIEAFVGGYIKR